MKIYKAIRLSLPVLYLMIFFGCAKMPSDIDDYTKFVDPMIGTDADGHTFPGALVPFGMVQLSPDTRVKTSKGSSGYHYSDSSIIGFSHTHLSGTGEGSGGDFLFMPTTGKVRLNAGDPSKTSEGYRSRFKHTNEYASPGYYKVLLDDYNITAELTASKRVGMHRYTFPKTDSVNIILDLNHGINDKVDSLELKIISNTKILGYRSSLGGLRMYQKLYFVAEFSKPFNTFGILANGKMENKKEAKGKSIKAFFRFINKDDPILIKVAISKVDIKGAEKNMSEIKGWDFESTKEKAAEMWNDELKKVVIKTNNENLKKIFYTSLYHSSIHPSLDMDIDGRYRSTNNQIYTAKGFTDFTNFSLWDTFRGLHPLHTIINTKRTNDFVNTFIERFEHSGSLPMFEISGNEVPSMIGYHSLPVIADAYIKGIHNYDIKKALNGMKKLANLPWEKRSLFKTFGFVPFDYTVQSVSRTLEYSFDDWCIAQVAKDINKTDYSTYGNRGEFYKNVFSKEVNFMRPKDSQYNWLQPFDPKDYSKHYTQANAYQYTSFVPQDIKGLVNLMGGDKIFENWLDNYFDTKDEKHKDFIGQYNHGNEPSHHTGYLYNYVGAPWKTQKIIREILLSKYDDSPNGLSGNDDAGQMSAWFVLSSIGFYSVTPGMDYFVIGSPLFDKVKIHLENGKTFSVIANNNSLTNPYIQSASLNGVPYSKSYINYSDIINGGTIIFEMGNKPNRNWATKKHDRPFSVKFNSPPMPKISVENKQIPPDGIITFKNNCNVTLSCDESKANIYYTTDGSEPDKSSIKYNAPFKISESMIVKCKAFKENFYPSYTSVLKFRKLEMISAMDIKNPKLGINYEYREVWLCKEVDDIIRYPILKKGVLSEINPDLGFKMSEKNGVIYSGYIKVPEDGEYIFFLNSDDGSVLLIDNIMIVNNDGSHRRRERNGKIILAKGYHSIVVKHFQVGGKPKLTVQWKSNYIPKEEIPAAKYFH